MIIVYGIIFGLIAASIASFFAPGSRGITVGLILLGMVVSIVGAYLGQKFFGVEVGGFNLKSLVVPIIGSLLVLFISWMLMRGKRVSN